jgi:integrase
MVRRTGRLSALEVRHAAPKAGRPATFFCDGGNLHLQCSWAADGSVLRSWTFRYQRDGRRREMGLGPLDLITLAEAREKARSLRKQLLDDVDPLEAKQAAKRARLAEKAKLVTFRQCAEMYLNLHRPGWKNRKHVLQWENSLKTYVYPRLGELSVADIDSAAVLKIVEPLWVTKTETGARVRARIESILDYASANGMRDGDNPARHIITALPKRARIQKIKHHAALPFADIADFLVAMRQREGVAARALEYLVLTAARTAEVIGATWAEVDLIQKIWIIPANRMKSHREHRVPLCERAIEILRSLPHEDGNLHCFIGARVGTGLSHMAFATLLRRMRRNDVTVHGFRSTFRDWAAERTNYPNHVVEMALAHAVGDKVEAAYRRGDLFEKRRRLMLQWADYCRSKPVSADIVPIGKPAAASARA